MLALITLSDRPFGAGRSCKRIFCRCFVVLVCGTRNIEAFDLCRHTGHLHDGVTIIRAARGDHFEPRGDDTWRACKSGAGFCNDLFGIAPADMP